MHATSQNILEAFNQLPEIEKHAIASEIIKRVTLLDIPPLTDEAFTEIADTLFVEHDKMEAADAETNNKQDTRTASQILLYFIFKERLYT